MPAKATMALLEASVLFRRGVLPDGDNSTDTWIGGVHFNRTALDHWNYTLYSNSTLSNGSWCLLAFAPYTPSAVLPNGTFLDTTWCYSPVKPIGARASIAIGFAVAFGLVLLLTVMNLAKHGKVFLPAESRFRPSGRRWQWYWAAITCVCAVVSLLVDVDVDRYYLPELPIVLTVFFWFLLNMAATACVWEAVRHWGSWMERQFVDPNPFVYRLDDTRAKVEFWLPLIFYLWLWMDFFMVVPRNWGRIEMQRYPQQTLTVAIPAATDARFKIAPCFLFLCWLTTVYSLRHSIAHYNPRPCKLLARLRSPLRNTPPRFLLLLPVSLAIPAYQALSAWVFAYSPLNVHGLNTAIYIGGYLPALLVVLLNGLADLARPNEDRELLRQRRERGAQVDSELGIVSKPAWWKRARDSYGEGRNLSMGARIARNVRRLGGGAATARSLAAALKARREEQEREAVDADARRNQDAGSGGGGIEMSPLPRPELHAGEVASGDFAGARELASRYHGCAGRSDRRGEQVVQVAAALLFPGDGLRPTTTTAADRMVSEKVPPPYSPMPPPKPANGGERQPARLSSGPGGGRPGSGERSNSTDTTGSLAEPPQKVRSMLDV